MNVCPKIILFKSYLLQYIKKKKVMQRTADCFPGIENSNFISLNVVAQASWWKKTYKYRQVKSNRKTYIKLRR